MSEKTKVLILSLPLDRPGGVSNYVKLLIKSMDKNVKYSHFEVGRVNENDSKLRIYFSVLKQLSKFKKKINEIKPDIIHFNIPIYSRALLRESLFVNIAHKYKIPIVASMHGWESNLTRKILRGGFWRYFAKRTFSKIDKFIELSNQFKKNLIKLGVDSDKIHVLSTMVESDKFFPGRKVFKEPFNVLFCSRIDNRKGHFELLESIPLVLKKHPKTKFIFMGDGPEIKLLKEKSKGMKNIEFTGYITGERKLDIFKKSHLFVFPTYCGEGFPTVFLEALSSGMPIVITPNAGISDVFKDKKHGFLISIPPNPKEIASKIIKLIENSILMKKISDDNLKEAKEKYDVSIICLKISKIYKLM